MSRAVLGVAGKGQQTSPEICIPCVLSSPGALEEVKGSRRAGGQNQPQAAAISHLRSLASPSLGIFAPCPDALWGVEEQEFRNKVWNCWPLLYQPLTQPVVPPPARAARVRPASGVTPLLLTEYLVQKCHRNW